MSYLKDTIIIFGICFPFLKFRTASSVAHVLFSSLTFYVSLFFLMKKRALPNGLGVHKEARNETALDRKKRGLKSKRNGQKFEAIIEIPARRESVGVVKIPSSCRWVGARVVPMKSPFDFVMCRDGVSVFFDAKSTSSKTFASSKIELHQLAHLERLANAGSRAGYVVYFATLDRVVFYSTRQLAGLFKGKSLKPDDGLQLGSALTLTLLPLFF